jgi:transcriptional regulator with XRE-family HTH domain
MAVMGHMMCPMPDPHPPVAVPELTLGWRLNMALRHGNIEIQQMADYLEVGRTTISRWIHDHGASPRTLYLKEWALRCGVDYHWLVTGEDSSAGQEPSTASVNNPDYSRVSFLLYPGSGLCKMQAAA